MDDQINKSIGVSTEIFIDSENSLDDSQILWKNIEVKKLSEFLGENRIKDLKSLC